VIGQGVASSWKRVGLDIKKKGCEALAHVAQRSCGCLLPGSVQGQVR